MNSKQVVLYPINYNSYKPINIRFLLLWILLASLFTVGFLLWDVTGIWVGVGLFFLLIVLIKISFLAGSQVPLVHLMVLNYFMELVVCSFILYFYPPDPIYDIGHDQYPVYLSYVVPCCIALYLGVVLAMKKAHWIPFKHLSLKKDFPAWAGYAKHFVWLGLFFTLVLITMRRSIPMSLTAIIVLLSSLRYVGFYTLILTGKKNWWIYGLLIFGVEIIIFLSAGFIHDLVLWGLGTLFVISYRYSWKKRVPVILLLGFFLLFIIQTIKKDYRQSIWNIDISIFDKISIFGDVATSHIAENNLFFRENISNTFARFNQGWIVNRVMEFVPDVEPYAKGTTLLRGLYAIIVPRFIDPNKPLAGGRENIQKFTGIILGEYTAMTISVAGEMYANFGPYGGIIGVGIFGYLIALLYRRLHKKALENPVWWAWGPFLGFYAIKTSEGLWEIIGWIVRGIIIMMVVIFISNSLTKRHIISKTK